MRVEYRNGFLGVSLGATSRNLIRHFLEMVLAMVVGMAVLGGLVSLVCSALGHSDLLDHMALLALLMPTYMTIGMTVWMRHRRHNWRMVTEMAAAMYAPFLILLVPFGAGLISGGALLAAGHLLMLLCMFAAMLYRRDEYSQDHGNHEGAHHGTAHMMHA